MIKWERLDRTVERTKPKLSEDAYPTIFQSYPSYLCVEPPIKRNIKKNTKICDETQKMDENAFSDWMKSDKISEVV